MIHNMNDHAEIGHLTKYDVFRVNRDQVMDPEIWFKIHTNVSNFVACENSRPSSLSARGETKDACFRRLLILRQRPPNHINS